MTASPDALVVAVLGPGRLGETHVAALARIRNRGLEVNGKRVAVLPALYGRNASRVAELAERYGVERTSTTLHELIDAPDVTVVDNCLSNHLHFEPLMRAIELKKHVFSEKPLTIELAEAVQLLGAARAAGVQHGVIQNMRFNTGPRRARGLVEDGLVGRVFSANVLFGYMVPRTVLNRPTWFYKKAEAGGGIVEDMMAHFFDLLRTLVGPIAAVYGVPGTAWQERREPDGTPFKVDVEDLASVSIRFENGAVGNCFATWVRRKHEEVPTFQIDGEDGSLYFTLNRVWSQTQPETPLFRYDARATQNDTLDDWRVVDVDPRDPFELQLQLFLEGVAAGRATPGLPTWDDAVTNQRLIQAAYRSVLERREVSPEEISLGTSDGPGHNAPHTPATQNTAGKLASGELSSSRSQPDGG
ncbi:MAG TPA: Gfo/Idh/MocA family oxidoreductase [Chloroflexota bacterium]|nr:Gfo/Idh/MocA family oxidoreductase [Chloroflexota bacterium]